MLSVQHLTVHADGKKIINDFSYSFEQGKVYAIMGPNGSGKSTFAYTVMGHPSYSIDAKSKIIFRGKEIQALTPDKRAKRGLFLSFQSPNPLPGVRVSELLLLALGKKTDAVSLHKKIQTVAKALHIAPDLLNRSLHEGASGGERKKLELLQGAILDTPVQMYDEIDTGVDVDALKTIATFLQKHKKGKTIILITHYYRILKFLRPDKVLIMTSGTLVKSGKADLALYIESHGYGKKHA